MIAWNYRRKQGRVGGTILRRGSTVVVATWSDFGCLALLRETGQRASRRRGRSLDRLIDGEHLTHGLDRRDDRVLLDERRLPDARVEVVADDLADDVDARPL
ncbi:hypothetical protein PMAYCL1PPCAC_21820, partial [Pristionchus mayeri]